MARSGKFRSTYQHWSVCNQWLMTINIRDLTCIQELKNDGNDSGFLQTFGCKLFPDLSKLQPNPGRQSVFTNPQKQTFKTLLLS